MMRTDVKSLLARHRETILYIFTGGSAAVVSMLCYFVFRRLFLDNGSAPAVLRFMYSGSVTLLPNILAWLCASTYVFVLSRRIVFRDSDKSSRHVAGQAALFYASRLLSLGIDAAIVFLCVDVLGFRGGFREFCVKAFSNLVIAVMNYFAGKFVIFRKKRRCADRKVD